MFLKCNACYRKNITNSLRACEHRCARAGVYVCVQLGIFCKEYKWSHARTCVHECVCEFVCECACMPKGVSVCVCNVRVRISELVFPSPCEQTRAWMLGHVGDGAARNSILPFASMYMNVCQPIGMRAKMSLLNCRVASSVWHK